MRRLLLAAALATASCGAPLLKLPSGAGAPAADAAAVLAQATTACRAIDTVTLEMNVHGTAEGRRLRGRLTAGLATPASARLEAVASFGEPVFVFVARDGDASLLLPRDRRVLEHGTPSDVLAAVTGVPIDPEQLRLLVTGCTGAAPLPTTAMTAFGDDWRVAADGADVFYLHRDGASAAWRLVARIRRGAWRAEYSMFDANLPHAVRLVSDPPGRFDLRIALSQIDVNVALGPGAFRLQTAGAAPLTLEELRESGPLGER